MCRMAARMVTVSDMAAQPDAAAAVAPAIACREYDEAGRLTAVYHRQGESREGPATWYNEAGQVLQQAQFRHGQLHGELQVFDRHGRLLQRCTYQDGKLEGPAFFYTDGQLQACVAFRGGRQDGE